MNYSVHVCVCVCCVRDLAVLCGIQHLLVRTELADNLATENTVSSFSHCLTHKHFQYVDNCDNWKWEILVFLALLLHFVVFLFQFLFTAFNHHL